MSKYVVAFQYVYANGMVAYLFYADSMFGNAFVLDTATLVCSLEPFSSRQQMEALGKLGAGGWGMFFSKLAFRNDMVSFVSSGFDGYVVKGLGKDFYFQYCSSGVKCNGFLLPFMDGQFGEPLNFYLIVLSHSEEMLYRLVFWVGGFGYLSLWVDADKGELLCYGWGKGFEVANCVLVGQDKGKYSRLLPKLAKFGVLGGRFF